ncbi:MAG: nucleotidyltransferase family protein [Bacillota bacterium]
MLMLAEIINKLRAEPELFEKYSLTEVGVFGSYIRNAQRENSDVDILIDYNPEGMSLFRFMDLQDELTKIIGKSVDLVPKADLKKNIGKRILNEVQYIWSASI